MTLHIADIAIYQGALRLEDVKAAGVGIVNIKVSHGLGTKSVHPAAAELGALARRLGLGISTFHWLTADAPGEAQAEHAYRRMQQLGLVDGAAHQLDVEAKPAPPLASVRGYLGRMTQLLGRPVVLYTGDWWWRPHGWDVSDLTPYLWAAPNEGYLGKYPGDGSDHWRAGYGGWPELAVMQYAVSALPGGTIKVSKSAIRDPAIWRSLTIGRPAVSYAPDSIMDARRFFMNTLRTVGVDPNPASFGVVGDDAHANAGTGYHLGRDALRPSAYSIVESSRDKRGLTNAASAFDIGWFSFKAGGKTHNLRTFSTWLVAQCKAGTADTLDIRDVIYSADGATVRRWDRLGIRSTGDDSHLTHTHVSYFRDSEKRDKTALFKRYFTEIMEGPVATLDNDDKKWLLDNLAPGKVADEVWGRKLGDSGTAGGQVQTLFARTGATTNVQLPALASAVSAVLKNVTDDDTAAVTAVAQILAAVDAATDETATAVLDRLGGTGQTDAEVAAALKAALGDRAAAVGALLAE